MRIRYDITFTAIGGSPARSPRSTVTRIPLARTPCGVTMPLPRRFFAAITLPGTPQKGNRRMVTGANTPLTVDLTGYKVAISAAANGIGKAMADSFACCGAQVFVSDIDAAAVAACGHAGMVADAGDPAQCESFIDSAVRHLGGL